MNIPTFMIGIAICLIVPMRAIASPYTNTVDMLKKELLFEDAESIVKQFIQKIYSDVTDADITGTIRNQIATVCGKQPAKQHTDCAEFRVRIRDILGREILVRAVGRNLQALTTGEELPVDGMPGRALDFSSRYQGIISIWQTGTGGNIEDVGTGVLVRTKLIDHQVMGPLVDTLRTKLIAVPEHERAAAVWRYQHGLRFVRGERTPSFGISPLLPFHLEAPSGDPDNGLNTERQDLFRRWNGSNGTSDIEQALVDIWSALPKNPFDVNEFDPPLDKKEIVLFIFGNDFLDQHMPENIIIWARIDGNPNAGWPWGDIGLHWQFPQEPALPSLIGDNGEAILGGRYPPAPVSGNKPVDGLGLCTHPFPAKGYLCRDRIKTAGEKCDESGQPPTQTNQITLMRCQQNKNATVKTTQLGPDLCADIAWRTTGINTSSSSSTPSRPVCDPREQVLYRNTIGNNACYIGACIEGSLEYHRLTSGQNTFVVEGQSYPWESRIQPEPVRTPILQIPPITQTTIPRYRPQLLIQKLDAALCQINGLPPRTPPALCLFDIRRALSYPGTDYQPLIQRLLMQGKEQHEPIKGLELTGAAIGTRIATSLYANYLRATTRSLADIIHIASTLLSSIKETEFPVAMCPFGTP
ncbi:hypothetical protein HYZ98_05410 [Candidatus Peregrinibacteria bacterium]|nr:hypothetical protein [Candidatus Peregrinibacteria bacterium]